MTDEEGDSIEDEDMEGIEEKGKNKEQDRDPNITTALFYSAVSLLHLSIYCAITQTNG